MKNIIFGALLLFGLLIPTSAFASTEYTPTNISYDQNTSQSFINQVLSFFGISNTNNNWTSTSNNYSESNCNNQPPTYTQIDCNNYQPRSNYDCDDKQSPPCDSNDLWSRWYCGGGQWGCF